MNNEYPYMNSYFVHCVEFINSLPSPIRAWLEAAIFRYFHMFIKWCDCFVKSSNHHECCVCSYPNQSECITSGDGETTPADEVCTLQCILVVIYMCLACLFGNVFTQHICTFCSSRHLRTLPPLMVEKRYVMFSPFEECIDVYYLLITHTGKKN